MEWRGREEKVKQKTIEKKYVLVQFFSSFLFYLLTDTFKTRRAAPLLQIASKKNEKTKRVNRKQRERERVFFQSLKFRRGSSGALGLGGARGGFKASRRSISAAAMAGRAAIDTTP
jgi:hypothetical protein